MCHIHTYVTHTYVIPQVDQEHERYFNRLKSIDPEFTSCITHFIVLDTEKCVGVEGGGRVGVERASVCGN